MQSPLKKIIILASMVGALWLAFLCYISFELISTRYSDLISEEIHAFSRRSGQQIDEVFKWINSQRELFATAGRTHPAELAPQTEAMTIDGRPLSMIIPVELAKKLENELDNGVNIRFVSNSPINEANLATSEDNSALMNIASNGKEDFFTFHEDRDRYHYVRPLFAQRSCLVCHTNVAENALLGAVIVETDPEKFVMYERHEKIRFYTMGIVVSSLIALFFYLLMLRIWKKNKEQGDNLECTQNMVESMNEGTEVVMGNISCILSELERGNADPQKAELLRTLQYINEDLRQASQAFTKTPQEKVKKYREELIHVDTFFRQCMQIFHAACLEKEVELTLNIDQSVPVHVLGDAFHLRKIVGILLKNAVDNTHTGAIVVRVRSAINMASHLSMKDLKHTPIHLLIEIEDTSKGYIITEQEHILQGYAAQKKSNAFVQQAVFDLRPVAKIAGILNGFVTVPQNSKSGATFLAKVQVKMIEEDEVRQALQSTHSLGAQAHTSSPMALNAAAENAGQNPRHQSATNHSTVHDFAENPSLPPSQTGASSYNVTKQSSEKSSEFPEFPDFPMNVRSASPELPPDSQEEDVQGPISVIIGDSGVTEFTQNALEIFKHENINVSLMATGVGIFETLDNPRHGYSVVLLRELSDLDITYTAIRIRYLERLGSPHVAIVIISEDIVQDDMNVLRFFNISTSDNFPRDADIATKVIRLAMRTKNNQVFHGRQLFTKNNINASGKHLFDKQKAMENAKHDKTLVHSLCRMWVRFYPEQLRRLHTVMTKGTQDDKLRLLRSIKNSASTVCLPMLWEEANRLEEKINQEENARYEKLLSLFEQTYEYLQKVVEEMQPNEGRV